MLNKFARFFFFCLFVLRGRLFLFRWSTIPDYCFEMNACFVVIHMILQLYLISCWTTVYIVSIWQFTPVGICQSPKFSEAFRDNPEFFLYFPFLLIYRFGCWMLSPSGHWYWIWIQLLSFWQCFPLSSEQYLRFYYLLLSVLRVGIKRFLEGSHRNHLLSAYLFYC